ncbi:CDK5 regulatory subunit-associated protein 2 [Aulostomus maculatus]
MMDSVVGEDLTLPVDINGSCRLPDSINAGEFSTDSMTAPSFPDKMSPIKALTMKDYENQITALKKENFNLKLRIYFMEERMQQKCDDSTEDIFKTNIELKVELESMKRDLAEKQELLVSASKALESLAGRESGEPQRVREQAQREMDALRDAFNKRIADLEQCLQTADDEVKKMAAIAEQEKIKNINVEKQLQALGLPGSITPFSNPVHDLQLALQDKDNIIEQLKLTLKNQEAATHQRSCRDQETDAPTSDCVKHLSDLIFKKDQELEALRDELHRERDKMQLDQQIWAAMRDLCRICGVRLVGSQCRWIFSSAAKRKLQIILSHVLGWEVTRDGRGEFLCGKCVFQLEKVIQCDINITQLQDEYNKKIQKLQAEKDHLIQCIVHIYNKNNPRVKSYEENARPKAPLLRSSAFDDEAVCHLASEGQWFRDSGGSPSKNRMRRCVSLDRIVSKGVIPGRSGHRSSRLGSAAGLDGSVKSSGLRGTRHSSQSMYLDLVLHKGTLPRLGFKDRSTSLQSLNRDFASETPSDPPPKLKIREAKELVARRGATDDSGGKAQARALLHNSSSQPSVISDLIQLLRCISNQKISAPSGSHIPVLKRSSAGHFNPPNKRRHKEAELKSLQELTEEFDDEYTPVRMENKVGQLESVNKQLNEELTQIKSTSENLTKTLEESQSQKKTLSGKLEEKENELNSEKKNALKRDKTIQGLTQVLKEKEKEITELCHEIEDRDDALAKARETAHKAQLQKYQASQEHQNLLMAKQTELAQLQGEHHAKVLEAQKLQRALDRKEQELADLQQAKDQLEVELEDLQQQKKKGDKALNDLNNQLKKMTGEIRDRESSLEQQYQELNDQTKRKMQSYEVTIQRLTSTLADKEQQLQEYLNRVRDFERSRSPEGNDTVLSKLRQRLKEKEKALERALDEKFAAIEEKDNEIHQLQLSLREKERDLDRLNNLLSHNEETINSFDSLIKEKDVELQHLANTLKNLQRAKQDVEDNLNRSLREKDSIISQLQLSLSNKTKDMEEMANSLLSQSKTHASDLAEQMGQRLKVTEAMLAEAVKARERLVADNESAVEELLATISSKDQLLKESAEHYNRMLSERTHEIQELRRQLSDRQQQLSAVEKQSSTTAQEASLETTELRALLAEKDSLINKLLQRGQERDHILSEMKQKEEPAHMLELRQTIQIMQEKLEKRDAELSRRNSEENVENISFSKKTFEILKKELSQKTEALNKVLKTENELKMSLVELQSLLSELEGRNKGQAVNIESLTATLKTKDEIIQVLHQRLGQRRDSQTDYTQDQIIGTDRSLPGLPQRERTMIGGDSQQETLPSLIALQQEHDALNKALRAEQQLYSSLVRTVKEQDSAQRLHALQLELTAVQLLRQQLEDNIKTNEELRDDLEREIDRAKLKEGMDLVDPKELESMRHQLEDAQRWNASLQARLGAIQNRGGGVGGANDGGDTLSFIGDQTSYMSICLGEGGDDSLSQLSVQELKQKVQELQDCVNRLQTLNNDLQSRLSQLEKSDHDAFDRGDQNLASSNSLKQQLEKTQGAEASVDKKRHPLRDKESQIDNNQLDDESIDSGLSHSREHAQSGNNSLDTGDRDSVERRRDVTALKSLLTDCGATSLPQLREELCRLRLENVELRGLLKEQTSTECKEKESTDASGNNSDGQAELRQSMERLQTDAKSEAKVIVLSKDKGEKSSNVVSYGETPVTKELSETLQAKGQPQSKITKQHVAKQRACVKSRLPVPVKLRVETCNMQPVSSKSEHGSDHIKTDALQRLRFDDGHNSHQRLYVDTDSLVPLQQSSSPSSTLRPVQCSNSPVGSDMSSELTQTQEHTQANAALVPQLELLHQECQEKEALINKLNEKLADWEDLHAQLKEKERLNCQYLEALEAAESTIAYLTACSLDNQGAFGSHSSSGTGTGTGTASAASEAACHSKYTELQKDLEEKEDLNYKLIDLLNVAEKIISSCGSQEKHPEANDLCLKIRTVVQQGNEPSNKQSSRYVLGGTEDSKHQLQQHAGSLQEALLEQNRLNAELQERLVTANNGAGQDGTNSWQIMAAFSHGEKESKQHLGAMGTFDNVNLNQEMTKVLVNCLNSAESAIASLTALCKNTSSLAPGRSLHSSSDLQMHLDKLQKALQQRDELSSLTESLQSTAKSSSNQFAASAGMKKPQELHRNLCLLCKVLSDHSQRISELQTSLQEERRSKEESEFHTTVLDSKGLPPSVQVQLETLHKALREKKKACKSLEEKLATAQSVIIKTPSPKPSQKALEQDDKGVQVDLQDLGYETSGKSENDREESSSTDQDVAVNPSCSASSLPSLLKHEQASYSSTENLDSTSSTTYPSSPALSSAKASLKSPQAFEDYGMSEDPLQLQTQVRELKVQLESQTKLILQMQNLLRRSSHSVDAVANNFDLSVIRNQEGTQKEDFTHDRRYSSGQLREKEEGETQAMKSKSGYVKMELERETLLNRSMSDQLQQARSRSASPARLDSLVQSQARELSQLRQQIKESRRLGALQRRQLEELNKAFQELMQGSEVDYYMGEVVRGQLDKSLSILDRLEGRLDKGDSHLDNEDVAALELSRSHGALHQESQGSVKDLPDSPAAIQLEINNLRVELEGERELLQQHISFLVQQNLTLAECTREQLDLLAKELQEKNRLIQSLQSQIRGQSPSSHHSSHSDLYHSDRTTSSCHSSLAAQGGNQSYGQRHPTDQTVGGAQEEGVSGHWDADIRMQGLQRENGRLQEQLRTSEVLNATLRSELDLHRSIMAQTNSHHLDHSQGQHGSGSPTDTQKHDRDTCSPGKASAQPHTTNSDLLAEHLQEIRALRQRLEESICTNDRLRQQLEKRLAEVEKDPAATNIFIQGNEEQGQLANEVQFLWGQNQALKEQLNLASRDKQKENEKLRDTLTRRTAKLEQSRKESEALRQENLQLQEKLEVITRENTLLQESLHSSKDELHRLQCEVKLQRQQLSDSQHLLQSVRVELQVYEKMKSDAMKHTGSAEQTSMASQDHVPTPCSGSVDLGELLSEIRHLRLQLERSIQTNTALRQRLEEQLLRGSNRSETININYLLSSPDDGGRSPGREGGDSLRQTFQAQNEHTSTLHEEKRHTHSEVDSRSVSSSSGESITGAPSRLVPGHRMWANCNGRHILALIEDYSALRKQISEGRKLSRSMETQLQDCLHTFKQQSSDNKAIEQQHLKSLSGSMNTMQQVLEEAGRLLKLVWRVSLPAGDTVGDGTNNIQQDELLKNEIARLKSRLSQQERMLSGAVKRLRTTNQLKEGMERVIIDQLSLTHGVLKKARGNLETNYCTLFGLKGPSGGPDEGGSCKWPVGDTTDTQTSPGPDRSAESPDSYTSDASFQCS